MRVGGPVLGGRRPPFALFLPVLAIILGGYLFFSRAFAWVHVPGVPLFAGELLLGVGIVQALRLPVALRTVIGSSSTARLLLVMMVAAALRTAWDVPTQGIVAVRDAAPWYYGILALLVAAMIVARPQSLDLLTGWYRRAVPIFLLWAPVAVFLSEALEDVAPLIPDSETAVVSFKPTDIAVHAAAAIAFLWIVIRPESTRERRQRAVLTAFGMLAILVAGTQFRSGLFAAVVVLGITAWFAPNRRQLVIGSLGALTAIVVLGAFIDIRIPLPRRDISLEQVTSNVVSIVDESEVEGDLQGSVSWRLELWSKTVDDLFEDEDWVTGVGFGPNLAERYDFLGVGGRESSQPLRNAHNSHLTILARGGIAIAVLWLLFWAALFGRLWRLAGSRRVLAGAAVAQRMAAWLVATLSGYMVNAFFDPSLEGPQVAVWAWSLAGIGLGSLLLARRQLGQTA